ncbi:hypothetical protein PUN28_015401 [Cardiocondyla obscurior]|uniref:Uncharacterized protein n=1 Tax=Cardiocondyla obscurior TaxID=286306 RepID=A0AAW2EXU4_9HYME
MWKVEKVSINFRRNSRLRRIKKTEFYLSRLRRNRETCTRELSDKTPRSSLPYNIFCFLFFESFDWLPANIVESNERLRQRLISRA